MTRALRYAGFDIPVKQIGYAHANCLIKFRKRQLKKEMQAFLNQPKKA